jgi:hypothetical protein
LSGLIDIKSVEFQILTKVYQELKQANTKHPLFISPHHGYAVILEEFDELWDEIKKKQPDKDRLVAEAVQVAAMAVKFIISLE